MNQSKCSNASMLRHPAVFVAEPATAIRIKPTMRTVRGLVLVAMIPLVLCSLGRAQTIYSNTFNGGAVNINQKGPTVATDDAGAASSAIWRDAANTTMLYTNGTVNTTAGDSTLLPFTPENGYIYTLTASVTFSGDPGSWIGAGFAQNYVYSGSGNAQFNQSGINGYDWAILTESSGNVQYFAGPSGVGQLFNQNSFFTPGPGTHTLTLTLNTTAAQWVAACYIDGVQAGTNYTYTTQPAISAVGITQHTLTVPSAIQWNSFTLQATGTRSTNPVSATISFSDTGVPLNPSFVGLSYEKKQLTTSLFSVTNAPLLRLFHMIGPAVIRVGGGTVDQTSWNGTSNAITPTEVDSFAAFMNGLPADWKVLYGINLETNTAANAADEAAYAANDLGTRLLGFELGNEPEFYWPYSTFLPNWLQEESAITTTVPGWNGGAGGRGWIMDGADAGQGQLAAYTDPFASDESGVASLLTQHYYVAGAGGGTMQAMLRYPNATLDNLVTNIVGAANGNQALGARITEAGSYSSGGILGVSNALGAALWSLDFMFTVAENGGQGVNFHGGGKSPYSPLNDDGTVVTSVGPEFYAMKMFSMIPQGGSVVPATVSLNTNANFTAYGVQDANGAVTALLNNKEVNDTVSVSVNLGADVSHVALISLTAPNLFDATGLTLGGAMIGTDGKWNGGVEAVLSAPNGQLTVNVPPATAYLLIPEKRQN